MPGKLHLLFESHFVSQLTDIPIELPPDYDKVPTYTDLTEFLEKHNLTLEEVIARKTAETKAKLRLGLLDETGYNDGTSPTTHDGKPLDKDAACREKTKLMIAKFENEIKRFVVKRIERPEFVVRVIVVLSVFERPVDDKRDHINAGDFIIEVTPNDSDTVMEWERNVRAWVANSVDICFKDKALVYAGTYQSDTRSVDYYLLEEKELLHTFVEAPNEVFNEIFNAFKQFGFTEEKTWFATRSFIHVMHENYESTSNGTGITPTLPSELFLHQFEGVYVPDSDENPKVNDLPLRDIADFDDDEHELLRQLLRETEEDEGVVEDIMSEEEEENSKNEDQNSEHADADNEYEADEHDADKKEADEYDADKKEADKHDTNKKEANKHETDEDDDGGDDDDNDDDNDDYNEYEENACGADETGNDDEDKNDNKDDQGEEEESDYDHNEEVRKLIQAFKEYESPPELDTYYVLY